MSWQAVEWAQDHAPHIYTDAGLPDTTARGVLVALAGRANAEGGNSHPSPLKIRYMTGYDVRVIERALSRLAAEKLITQTGVYPNSPVAIWQLSVHIKRPDSEWDDLKAEADDWRRGESAKRKARRLRRASADQVSGTENAGHPARKMPDIRHAESRMSGTENPLNNNQEEPPMEPSLVTVPGCAPPPDPRGLEVPSGLRTENLNSFSEGQDPLAQDQESNHRPRAREEEDRRPDRCVHGNNPRKRRDGTFRCPECQASAATTDQSDDATPEADALQANPVACSNETCHMGYVLDASKPKNRNVPCPTCNPSNVIPFGRRRA